MDQRSDFDERLRKARVQQGLEPPPGKGDGGLPAGSWGLGLRIGTELVSALAVGLIIGLALDRWLGTSPWLLLVFFFAGGAAGVLNLYRLLAPGRAR
ncbi:AtpZ/AtpI family protein [Roseomonas elaeocarpi]|uniref:AtpZ/AtpI family protein n=1 Tax=Roseomonas elaeocarpi TaxID=907779 RepID=A0ABV6JVR4_9PROT